MSLLLHVRTRMTELLTRFPALYLLPLLGVYLAIPLVVGPGELADEGWYLDHAKSLLHGTFAGAQEPGDGDWLAHGPGLPLVLVPLVAVDVPTLAIRCIVGPGFLFLAVVVFYQLANMYVRRSAALLLALVFGCAFLPYFQVLRVVYTEPLTVLLITLIAYRIARWHATRRVGDLLLTGALAGLLALTRVEFGYLLVVWLVISGLLLLILPRRRDSARFALAACCIGLTVCIPYLVYTGSVAHRFFYWSNSGGGQLYWMASGQSSDLGDWLSPDVFSVPQLAPHRPFFRSLRTELPVDQDLALREAAFDNIRDDPPTYVRNLVLNASRQVFNSPYSYTPTKWRSVIGYGATGASLVLLFLWSVGRFARRPRSVPPEMVIFAALAITTFALHTVVAAYGRMFTTVLPMTAIVAIFALTPTRFRTSPPQDVREAGPPPSPTLHPPWRRC